MHDGAAQAWFIAGTVPLVVAGGLHAAYTLADVVRPRFFAPTDAAVQPVMESSGLRFRQRTLRGGDLSRPSMWRAWLGFNISHGLGIFTFALLCLLIAAQDFSLVERIHVLRPLAIAFSAVYLAISLRFWFWGPVLITGTATVCFTVAALLSA
jgi:hypothetical protein